MRPRARRDMLRGVLAPASRCRGAGSSRRSPWRAPCTAPLVVPLLAHPRGWSVALASVLCAASAHAEPATRSPEMSSETSPETFVYTTPTEKNYLRAVLELEALTTVSVVWYVIDVRQGGDVGYRWQTFERKLSGAAIGHDDNGFGTNFRGHGLGGNAYYLSA